MVSPHRQADREVCLAGAGRDRDSGWTVRRDGWIVVVLIGWGREHVCNLPLTEPPWADADEVVTYEHARRPTVGPKVKAEARSAARADELVQPDP